MTEHNGMRQYRCSSYCGHPVHNAKDINVTSASVWFAAIANLLTRLQIVAYHRVWRGHTLHFCSDKANISTGITAITL